MIIIYYLGAQYNRAVRHNRADSRATERAVQHTTKSTFVTSRLHLGLGTFVAIEAAADTLQVSDLGVAAAFGAVARVERLMHPWRDGSDLAALRDGALGVPVSVHAWTWATLELCKRLNRLSRGVFDPCLPGSRGRLCDLELRQPHCVIQHARLELDLGGIAKGFAVDRAIDALRRAGCRSGLVNAGGDLAAFGDRQGDVCCRHRGRSAVIELRNAALAASDTESESRPTEHQGYYNGADPQREVSGHAAVMAPIAAIADGLTKCLLAGDESSNAALLDAFDARQIRFTE
jgi:thiamine biosynthesis lipoprotein